MRKPILFFIALFLYGAAISQVVVDPKDFPAETNPQQSNFEFYSRKTGTNKKATFDNVRKRMLPTLSFPNNITYTPSNTGNTANLGQFVTDPNGKIWYIDGLGVAKWVNTPASIALPVADNDEAARLMCVPLNGWYRLSANNTIGAAPGTLRQRIYGAALSLPCTPSTTSAIPGETVIYGGGGILKTSGDPDSNSYVKRQFQWYEASAAWDTVRNELYFYHGADPVGSRWDKFTGGGGLTNGDKVDIDVRGLGDTLIIDTGAVTSVKILDGTIVASDLATTGVTAGSYTNTNLTVNSKGQITAASNGAAAGSSIDSTFAKAPGGSYTAKRITDPVFRYAPIGINTTDTAAYLNIKRTTESTKPGITMTYGDATTNGFNVLAIRPTGQTGGTVSDFDIWATNFAGANLPFMTAPDHVVRMGLNVGAGGGRKISTLPNLFMAMEHRFHNTLLSGQHRSTFEFHLESQDTLGVNHRFMTAQGASDGVSGDVGFNSDGVYFSRYNNLSHNWLDANRFNYVWAFRDSMGIYFDKNGRSAGGIYQRNAANSAYIDVIYLDNSNRVVNGGTGAANVYMPQGKLDIAGTGQLYNTSGNVVTIGVVSTAPTRLDVNGPSNNALFLKTATGGSNSWNTYINSDNLVWARPDGNAIIQAYTNAPSTIWANNKIGIGSNVQSRLSISQISDGAQGGISLINTGGTQYYLQTNSSGDFSLRNDATGAEKFALSQSGALKLNTYTSLSSYSITALGALGFDASGNIGTYLPTVSISALTSATATNSIDNLNYAQTWAWSTMTTGTPLTWTNAGLTSGTGLLHTANALTSGTIHQLSTSNNSLNSSLGLLYVANNGTSTSGLLASFQANSTAESGMYVAASGKVGIGETAPLVTLDVRGTDAIQLPRGTTAQRPGSPTSGMVRMNDDVNILEYYDGSAWASINGLLPTEGYTNVTSTSSPVTLTNAQRDNLINQGGTQATFTFNLPASPINGQLCYLSFNNIVTTLTISGNGTTLNGTAATTAAVGTRLEYKYYSSASAWIRVQ